MSVQFHAWFMHYHKYTRQLWYDDKAVRRFVKHCRWAQKNNIQLLILCDYHRNYPEYLSFWSEKTLKGFVRAAKDHGIMVLSYTSPTGIDPSSDFYRDHGDECAVRVRSPSGTINKQWGWITLPDGGPYREDYRGTYCAYIPADPTTGWKDYYLEQCEGLLEFGFDGIYIDQHQESTESAEHPAINLQMMDMLTKMRDMVKSASQENVICANVMFGPPEGKKGEEFVRRTRIADYGLTESLNEDISSGLRIWMQKTALRFFFLSHGDYESHRTKVRIARKLKQSLCLMVPMPLDEADPRILELYEKELEKFEPGDR